MEKNKYFIITVDTEGDDLWSYHLGKIITTENSRYIPRFQQLCNQFDFKPVYLTNYEMASDQGYVDYIKEVEKNNQCEIGIHVHAWNNPPFFDLKSYKTDNPYLIEYPEKIMRAKFQVTYELIKKSIGVKPISHRAGRWAMNEIYFKLLQDFDIKVDCSHTPSINWSKNIGAKYGGSDYRKVANTPTMIGEVLEVPVSVLPTDEKIEMGLKTKIQIWIKGKRVPYKTIWLRPAQSSLEDMKKLVDAYSQDPDRDYLEFMIHSSELMPNGSPYFITKEAVEREYSTMERLFDYVRRKGYVGITLKNYYNKYVS